MSSRKTLTLAMDKEKSRRREPSDSNRERETLKDHHHNHHRRSKHDDDRRRSDENHRRRSEREGSWDKDVRERSRSVERNKRKERGESEERISSDKRARVYEDNGREKRRFEDDAVKDERERRDGGEGLVFGEKPMKKERKHELRDSRQHNEINSVANESVSRRTLQNILCSSIKFLPFNQTLKRRSAALDDGVGSIGPIRRIRKKSDLLAPRIRQSSHEVGSDAKQKLQIIGRARHNVSKNLIENENESVPSTSYAPVPSKSSAVAAKISQHLEKMTPKEKSSESKSSSLKLTPSMLSGQALRSMEDLDSSKLLMDVQDDHKLGDRYNAALTNAHDSTSQKQGNLEENVIKESVVRSGTWNPAMNNDSAVSLKAPGPSSRPADSAVKNGPSQPPQKKRAFRMSAQEESFEQEDDVNFKELATRPLSGSREPMEAPFTVSMLESREEPKLVKTIVQSETKSPSKISELSSRDAIAVGEKSSMIGFPTSDQATSASESAVLPVSVAKFDRSKEANKSSPLFSFSSTVADKFPSLPLEPSSKKRESELENSSSVVNVPASTGSQVGSPVLEKDVSLNPQKVGDINGKYDAMSDRPHVSRPLVPSAAASHNYANQTSSGGALLFSSSVPDGTGTSSCTTTNSSGNIFGLAAIPSISAGPVFKFGASVDPSPSVSAVSTTNVPEIAKPKIIASFGTSHSTVAAFSAASSGSGSFGLGSSLSYSTSNNPQNTLDKSLVSAARTVSQPTFAQAVSSASIPSFNMTSSTSFGSSLSSSQLFNQQSSFGFSSSASTSDTSPVVPSSAPASSLFRFGASSSDGNATRTTAWGSYCLNSSSATNAFGSSSGPTTPTLFSLAGSSASASTSVTNTARPNPFSSGNPFNFGGTSSASSSAIRSNTASSSIFGSTFTSQSPSTTGFSFGASSTSSTPTNAPPILFNSPTSSPFSFTTAPASMPQNTLDKSLVSAARTVLQPTFAQAVSSASIPSFNMTSSTSFGSSLSSSQLFNQQSSFGFSSSASTSDTSAVVPSSAPASSLFRFGASSSDGNATRTTAWGSYCLNSSSATNAFGSSSGPTTRTTTPGFAFGSTQASTPFMFGGQQNQVNPSPFQASGSLEFNAGGSFSLGSGDVDKSGRKIVKVNRNKNRRKRKIVKECQFTGLNLNNFQV